MRNNTCKRKKPRPFWATLRQSANLFQDATAAKRRNLEEAGNHRLFVSRENSTQKPLKNEKYPKVETWNFQALHDEMRYVEDADVCCFFWDSPKNHWEPNREATILKGQYVLKMARNFDVFSNWSPDLDPQRWCLIVGGLWRSPPKNAIAHDGCSLWGDAWVQRLVGGVCSNFDVGDGHVAWREVIHITRGRVFFWGGKGLGCSKATCWKRGW